MSDETAWNAAVQVEDWAGELRVNLVRCAAIAAFYGQHLITFFVSKDAISPAYHTAATAVTITREHCHAGAHSRDWGEIGYGGGRHY